ncbi:MAG: amidohydrolase family protein [Chloroflexi bacterium]|nr:amidohydrolase family protein [Chloroflexota bacterium]
MIIVDTHCHASPYWHEPVESLLFHMNMNRVDKATLIQYLGQYDNQYMLECERRFPGRFCTVVIVDTDLPDAPATLKRWLKAGAQGIRLRGTTRSPGSDPMAIWRVCNELHLPVSCGSTEDEFASDQFYRLAEAVPDAPIIIEHLGHVSPEEPLPYATFRRVLRLAKLPNVYIKVGGLGEICPRPYPFRQPFYSAGVPPFIKMAYEAFGPRRMTWGSNYSPCGKLEGYRNTLEYVIEHLGTFCPREDFEWVMGKTARSLFRFEGD